jgi:hypothetical protein
MRDPEKALLHRRCALSRRGKLANLAKLGPIAALSQDTARPVAARRIDDKKAANLRPRRADGKRRQEA